MYNVRKKLKIDPLHHHGYLGAGVTVAVLDSGVFPHADIKEQLVLFRDYINERISAYDDNSHGTHVSGIIAGNGRSCGGVYTGMAPAASLIAIKVLRQDGTGSDSSISKGIDFILKNRKKYNIRLVNISIGTDSHSCEDEKSELVLAVNELWDNNIAVIASAGNNGPDYRTITTPGISRKIITVGTTDIMSKTISSGITKNTYSGKGPTHCSIPKPDLVAPGKNIISCAPSYNRYEQKSGTSMSTPIVTGAAALIFSHNSDINNNELKDLLCKNAMDMGYDKYTQGHGMLNISNLLIS